MTPAGRRYLEAIAAARQHALALTADEERILLALLQRWADVLAVRVAAGIESQTEAELLRVADQIIRSLTIDLARSVRSGVQRTTADLAEMHRQALAELARASGRAGLAVALPGIDIEAAAAVLSRPELSAAFVSVRQSLQAEVDAAIRDALLRGSAASELAMRLRTLVVGAGSLPTGLLLDQRLIGKASVEAMGLPGRPDVVEAVRKAARQVRLRAELIARTEIQNARHEVEVKSAAESPVVGGLQRKTSGRHPAPDICDDAADTDWYGLGAGVFPAELALPLLHPRCLCYDVHILRPASEWGRPKGGPPELLEDPRAVAEAAGRSPSQVDALVAAFDAARSGRKAA